MSASDLKEDYSQLLDNLLIEEKKNESESSDHSDQDNTTNLLHVPSSDFTTTNIKQEKRLTQKEIFKQDTQEKF
jgi:hypothetical protein